jgi:hypothetical protein
MSETILKFSDENYTIKVTHEKVGSLNHVTFHRQLPECDIDSKFDMFLSDAQFSQVSNFLWFLTGKGNI